MKKKNEPIIRQTEKGPMREFHEKSPLCWYVAGAFCLLFACFFPLYRLVHFLLLGALTAGVFLLTKHLTPEHVRLVPCRAEPTGDAAADDVLKQGAEALIQLQNANSALKDDVISSHLDRIEAACRRIFDYIREHPEQAGQTRKFMNYYLPTLLSLLKIRTELESQGADGSNIDASKKRIDAMLEQTAVAFDNFYDQLHADQALDVSAEISVFQNMLQQEGLLQQGH